MTRYLRYLPLVFLLALAAWGGHSCATTADEAAAKQLRQQVHDTAAYLRRTRLAFEATMQTLIDERATARRARTQQEIRSHGHARKALAHADTASTLQRGQPDDATNPWYLVAIQRQREAQEERLARIASDSAIDASVKEVDALERQNAALMERLVTAERAALVADTALTRAEREIRRAKFQVKLFGGSTTLLLLLGVLVAASN